MENSVLAILYMTCFGVRLSDGEVELIRTHLSASVAAIYPRLHAKTKEKLEFLDWRRKWLQLLSAHMNQKVKFVSCFCDDYPLAFRNFSDSPLFFTYLGLPIWKHRKFLSVVGSRNPSPEALRWMSMTLPSSLKRSQISVVSGGARGVDQWAHQLGVASGVSTLAFLPSGLERLYPQSFQELIPDILNSGGAVISGYGLDQEMRVHYFHQRNGWIAQMGEACFVIEAAKKSGSLLTANLALNLGKDVMTIPYSPWSRKGEGNLELIKDGADMITSEETLSLALAKFSPAKDREA